MYLVLCMLLPLAFQGANAKCSYSFVVNEVDPSTCPCLLEQPSSNRQGDSPSYGAGMKSFKPNQGSGRIDANFNSILYNEGSASDNQEDENISVTQTEPPTTSPQLEAQLQKLRSNLKDLEIKVYRESVENRELKNLVIKQEQSMRDYKYLVERLKTSFSKQQVSQSREKGLLEDEIMTLKRSLELLKETLHKQDYYLKTLEKSTQDLQLQLNPALDPAIATEAMLDRGTKTIPVQSTSQVHCDGISKNATKYKDCDELFQRGHRLSGVYYVTPAFTPCPIPVYCKMDGSAGWLVIQRRLDGSLSFNRDWNNYRDGFGNLNHEFWLGNNNIFLFTNQASYRLRIDLWDFNDTHRYAEYLYFTIAGERDKYRLFITNYTGNAKDSLVRQNGMMFSTFDEDNDSWPDYHCAKSWGGGWWYSNCWFAILNGKYYFTPKVKYRGMSWNEWKPEQLKRSEMMISPSDYL